MVRAPVTISHKNKQTNHFIYVDVLSSCLISVPKFEIKCHNKFTTDSNLPCVVNTAGIYIHLMKLIMKEDDFR